RYPSPPGRRGVDVIVGKDRLPPQLFDPIGGTMMNSSFKTLLVAAASTLALAACGGSAEVASPGEGDFGNGGGGNPGGPGTPGTGQAAADCPTGFANVGTIANGTLRNCQLPQQINGSLTVPLRAGTIYSISGRTAVGTDGGVDASANAGTQGILTVEAGVTIFASGGGDYLLVNRGSQIYAEGTASQPIILDRKSTRLDSSH